MHRNRVFPFILATLIIAVMMAARSSGQQPQPQQQPHVHITVKKAMIVRFQGSETVNVAAEGQHVFEDCGPSLKLWKHYHGAELVEERLMIRWNAKVGTIAVDQISNMPVKIVETEIIRGNGPLQPTIEFVGEVANSPSRVVIRMPKQALDEHRCLPKPREKA